MTDDPQPQAGVVVPRELMKPFEMIVELDKRMEDGASTMVNISAIRALVKAAAPASPPPSQGEREANVFDPLRRAPLAAVASLDGSVTLPLVCITVDERDAILAAISLPVQKEEAWPTLEQVARVIDPDSWEHVDGCHEAMKTASDETLKVLRSVVDRRLRESGSITTAEQIDALYSAARPDLPVQGEPVAWRGIESAPKDGSQIIMWCIKPDVQDYKTNGPPLAVIGNWDRDCWNVPFSDDWIADDGFTHWMPLPTAPQQQEGE